MARDSVAPSLTRRAQVVSSGQKGDALSSAFARSPALPKDISKWTLESVTLTPYASSNMRLMLPVSGSVSTICSRFTLRATRS